MLDRDTALPREIKLLICSFLTPEELGNFALVSKCLYHLAHDNGLWEILYNIHFAHAKINVIEATYEASLIHAVMREYRENDLRYKRYGYFFSTSQAALFNAVKHGSSRLPTILDNLEKNATDYLKKCDINDYNPFMWALAKNNPVAINLLKEKGGKIKASRESLLFAVKHDHLEVVKEILIKKPALAKTAKTDYDNTAFHSAALHGHQRIVKYFVEHLDELGLSIDELTTGTFANNTPLQLAVRFSQKKTWDVIKYLLTQTECPMAPSTIEGAFIDAAYYSDQTALQYFLRHTHLPYAIQNQALAISVSDDNVDNIKTLYQYGHVDLYAPSNLFSPPFSALETAIFWNLHKSIAALIEESRETDIEKVVDAYYRARAFYLNPSNSRDDKENAFHHKMQHPVNGTIDFSKGDGSDKLYFHRMSLYFMSVFDHRYFLRKTVHTIDFSKVGFEIFSRFALDVSNTYFSVICNFIAYNPNIKTLNLTDTRLDNKLGGLLCEALKKNTYLTEIILDKNPQLSAGMIEKINEALDKNKDVREKVAAGSIRLCK